jgi:hypothetical protein
MPAIEVKIDRSRNGFGMAFGQTSDGTKVMVVNGDLLERDHAVVIVTGERDQYLLAEIQETYDYVSAIVHLLYKDNLVAARALSLVRAGIFSLNKKYVFPVWEVSGILDYVFGKPDLWAVSRLALTKRWGNRVGAMRFGLTFQKAIEKLTKSGNQTARLYCPVPEKFSDRGQTADMLASVHSDKEGNWVLEVWQGIGHDPEVFYAHALVQQSTGLCKHFDTAIIGFSIQEKERLFDECRKIKGNAYKKVFRMDGAFSMDVVHELANRFFPFDELIDEYFEVEPL